jgi:hypothetical protein
MRGCAPKLRIGSGRRVADSKHGFEQAPEAVKSPCGHPRPGAGLREIRSDLTYTLRMEAVQQGAAVQLTTPDVGVFRIPIVRRPLPRRGGLAILYRCPGCARPRRLLYLRSLVIGRLVDYQGPLCQACAGLRWASQGRYLGVLHRAFRAGLGLETSDRLPFPRHPRDPRAVSDPRLILDEFPDLVGDRPIGLGPE